MTLYTTAERSREIAELVLYVAATYLVKVNRPMASHVDQWTPSVIRDANELSGGSVADLDVPGMLWNLGVEPRDFAAAVRAKVQP